MSETERIESRPAEICLQLQEESEEQKQEMSKPEQMESRTAETSLQEESEEQKQEMSEPEQIESRTAETSLQEGSEEQKQEISEPEQIESRTAETSLQEGSEEQGKEENPPVIKRSERLVSDKGKPINAALAKVIKVGDRVTWNTYHASPISQEHQGQEGLVAYAPSRWMYRHGDGDHTQCVDVTFDNGDKYCCFMGHKGQYHLQLVE